MAVQVADLRPGAIGHDPLLPRVEQAAAAVLLAEGRAGVDLSVTLVDDPRMAALHEQYLGVSGPTDVLSFPLEDDLQGPLGEVVVSADTAAREASERSLPFERELLLYVIHGTLHLLGYDDQESQDRDRMQARQEELLEQVLTLDPPPSFPNGPN